MRRRTFLGNSVGGIGAYSASVRDAHAAGTSRVPNLKIADVKAARFRQMGSSFVRVYTDQGIMGTGEMVNEVGSVEIINQFFRGDLKGRDPLDIERIYVDFWSRVFERGLGGPWLTAVSGIDVALWDIAGKALGVPIYRLFGGPVRRKLAVYFHHSPHLETPEQAAEMVRRTGVRAFKTTIDRVTGTASKLRKLDPEAPFGWELTSRQLDEVAEFMRALRQAVGPDIEIALECHTKYSTETAIQIAKVVEPFRPMWLEEPIPSDNPDAMALIRRATRVPIACGENVYTRYGFRPFLEKQAVSVIQPDMLKCGGLLETRKIAAMAEVYGVPIAPHGTATPLGKMAMSHICATVPNFKIQEWSTWEYGQQMAEPVDYRDGFVSLPDKPGIGIELRQEVVKERILPGYELPAA
jgi:galactonate dehydratase